MTILLAPTLGRAELVVEPLGSRPPADLVTALLGGGITATNIEFRGTTVSAGSFSGGGTIIGFESGILLSSGAVTDVIGPNVDTILTNFEIWDLAGCDGSECPGDADLEAEAGVAPGFSFDAAVLEFDFTPENDTLHFEYVFSSEEYNDYVGSEFNDIFAFFLDGVNVALIPGTDIRVSINNVNNCDYPGYYVNNRREMPLAGGCMVDAPAAGLDTEMDGLTVVLAVDALVTAGTPHHIKLAIGDITDSGLDSNVFIRASSFASLPTPTPTLPLPPTVTPVPPPDDSFRLWPNPFVPREAVRGTLKAVNMPAGSRLCIYTVSGESVAKLPEQDGRVEWDGLNLRGGRCSSGTYYYLVEQGEERFARGKFILIDR